MTSSHDGGQLSFDFDLGANEVAEAPSVEPRRETVVIRFTDALSQKVRQHALQRVTAAGIFSLEELKEG